MIDNKKFQDCNASLKAPEVCISFLKQTWWIERTGRGVEENNHCDQMNKRHNVRTTHWVNVGIVALRMGNS